MAWEWVAPAGTAAVGITGIAATFFTARQGRQHAENVAAKKNAHDLDLAREQRQQQRRAEAYVEILVIAEQVGQWVSSVVPMFDYGQKVPDLPDLDRQARANALINAYGSSKAIVFYKAWRNAADEAFRAAMDVLLAERGENGHTDLVLERRKALDTDLRGKEADARKVLGDELAAELNGTRRFERDYQLNWKVEPCSPESP
jgi:hypothetical protein